MAAALAAAALTRCSNNNVLYCSAECPLFGTKRTSPETTALVEPRAFTTGLMHAAQAHGAMLQHGTVVDLLRSPSGAVRGVSLAGGEIVEGDAVVIAMGPWSI